MVEAWAVVVAQWVERLLPTIEIRDSNLVIGNFDLFSTVLKRQKQIKEKILGMS